MTQSTLLVNINRIFIQLNKIVINILEVLTTQQITYVPKKQGTFVKISFFIHSKSTDEDFLNIYTLLVSRHMHS